MLGSFVQEGTTIKFRADTKQTFPHWFGFEYVLIIKPITVIQENTFTAGSERAANTQVSWRIKEKHLQNFEYRTVGNDLKKAPP